MADTFFDPFNEDRTKSLFLLVGANPLPNAVVAVLLIEQNGEVYLLHSNHTLPYAQSIASFLASRRKDVTVICEGIDHAHGAKIHGQVAGLLERIPTGQRIGLNYTGGTKPMSIFAREAMTAQSAPVVFSYLDADTLNLFVEGKNAVQDASLRIRVSLEEIAGLHKHTFLKRRNEPCEIELAHAIRRVHNSTQGIKDWRCWLRQLNQNQNWVLPVGESVKPVLDLLENWFPSLNPQVKAQQLACRLRGVEGDPIEASKPFCEKKPAQNVDGEVQHPPLKPFYNWLNSGWLEEITLNAVRAAASDCKFHDYGINLEPIPVQQKDEKERETRFERRSSDSEADFKQYDKFELDVAAMRGYQLFAFSCINSDRNNAEVKKHLYQVFIRARQLGGDEARVALVCNSLMPGNIQRDLARIWQDWGQVRVFGRDDLDDLTEKIKIWVAKSNPKPADN